MIAAERARHILERLKAQGAVQVGALATDFGVAEETIRRDLARLESTGRLVRTHGGAIQKDDEDLPYPLRRGAAQAAKAAIARRAAAEVQDGMTLMIDSSSTAYAVLAELGRKADLTIVTNSVPICADPAVTPHAILSTGGELRRRSMTFVGPMAVAALARFRADVAIIGAKALSRSAGIMEASLADADMKQAFIANARRTLLVADTSKFDTEGTVAVGALGLVDALVTETSPVEPWMRILVRENVSVCLPDDD